MLRLGVIGVFVDEQNRILVGERADIAGAWQLPQGGIDNNEDSQQAVLREMSEELGTSDIEVTSLAPQKTKYYFPKTVGTYRGKYQGQEHYWFQLRFVNGASPDISKADGEFQKFDWITAKECVERIVDWKQPAYREGLTMIGLLD